MKDAIAAASPFGEIWIAEGIYYPDVGVGLTDNDPKLSFSIASTTRLYGGFSGNETKRAQRNPSIHKTVLSGDLEQNDTNKNEDGVCTDTAGLTGDNSYHVVSQALGATATSTGILDGLIITCGHAKTTLSFLSDDQARGGGIYAPRGGMQIVNCLVAGNSAYYGGGYHGAVEDLLILDSLFTLNTGSRGGGISFENFSLSDSATIANTAITGNTAFEGAGIYIMYANTLSLINVTLEGNQGFTGKSIRCDASADHITIANSLLWSSSVVNSQDEEIDALVGTSPVFLHSMVAGFTLDEADGNINPLSPILIDQTGGSLNSIVRALRQSQPLADFTSARNGK